MIVSFSTFARIKFGPLVVPFLSDPGEGMDTEERSVSVGEKGELRPNAEGFLPEETRRLEFGVVALAFLSFPTGTYSLVLSIVMTGTRGC